MQWFLNWLSEHKFQSHLVVLILIALPPIGMYFTVPSRPWSLALLALVAFGNLLAVLTH